MTIGSLREAVRGTVIVLEDGDYEAARQALLWNGRKPGRRPLAIVRVASVEDVQAVVRFAAARGCRVSARGGGHHWAGVALQEGIILDLSALNDIAIDAEARIAEVGPAVRNGALARALGDHGLAFPTGHCETVPLSGYLLGGGFGWNSGAWGLACFNVEAVEVVTADGEIRQASATENPEIFWAARGAGPAFFGIVTRYRLRLHPLPRAITTSVWTYPLADIRTVERWMAASMAVVPENVEFSVMMGSAPPPLAAVAPKVATAIATVFAESEAEARATLARIAEKAPDGTLDVQEAMPTPFEALYAIIGQFFPEGRRYAVDSFWAAAPEGRFLETLAEESGRAPSPETFSIGVILPPPAAGAPGLPDTAFSMVGPIFGCSYAIWRDPADDDANVDWLRRTANRLAPETAGHYVGEADLDRPGRLERCFSPAAWSRLQVLQARFDPAGRFRIGREEAAMRQSA